MALQIPQIHGLSMTKTLLQDFILLTEATMFGLATIGEISIVVLQLHQESGTIGISHSIRWLNLICLLHLSTYQTRQTQR